MNEDREPEAKALAGDHLIPSREWKRFTKHADFSLQAIQDFAEHVGIAPGIVVGRLQHEGQLPHTHGNRLKIFYRWKQRQDRITISARQAHQLPRR